MSGASDMGSKTFGTGKTLRRSWSGGRRFRDGRDDLGKVDVAEVDLGKAGCGGDFELDSGRCGLLGESSRYQGHVSSF